MKILLFISAILFSINCSTDIKYAKNPSEGKAFFVTFQEKGVETFPNRIHITHYSGSCVIVSKLKDVATIVDIRNTATVSNIKTSITQGVVLSYGQSTEIQECFTHPAQANGSVFQIVYKIGDSLYTDDVPVTIVK